MHPGIALSRFNPSCCSVSNVTRCIIPMHTPRDRGNRFLSPRWSPAFSCLYVILPSNGKRRSDIFTGVLRNGEVSGFIGDRRDVFGGVHWHLFASFFVPTLSCPCDRRIGVCYSVTRKTCSMASVKRKPCTVRCTTNGIMCNCVLFERRFENLFVKSPQTVVGFLLKDI